MRSWRVAELIETRMSAAEAAARVAAQTGEAGATEAPAAADVPVSERLGEGVEPVNRQLTGKELEFNTNNLLHFLQLTTGHTR